jgi:hypothetical protein
MRHYRADGRSSSQRADAASTQSSRGAIPALTVGVGCVGSLSSGWPTPAATRRAPEVGFYGNNGQAWTLRGK